MLVAGIKGPRSWRGMRQGTRRFCSWSVQTARDCDHGVRISIDPEGYSVDEIQYSAFPVVDARLRTVGSIPRGAVVHEGRMPVDDSCLPEIVPRFGILPRNDVIRPPPRTRYRQVDSKTTPSVEIGCLVSVDSLGADRCGMERPARRQFRVTPKRMVPYDRDVARCRSHDPPADTVLWRIELARPIGRVQQPLNVPHRRDERCAGGVGFSSTRSTAPAPTAPSQPAPVAA